MVKLNRVELIGNVGRDPDLKFTPSGNAKLEFSIGVDDSYKQGEKWVDSTQWANIVAWGNMAERAAESLEKGSLVLVHGRYTQRSWDDKDGKKQYRTEIVADLIQGLIRPPKKDDGGSQSRGEGRSRGRTVDPDDMPWE